MRPKFSLVIMKVQREKASGRILLGDDTCGEEVRSHRVYTHSWPLRIPEYDLLQNFRKVGAAYVMMSVSNSRKAKVVPHISRRHRSWEGVYIHTFLTSALIGGEWSTSSSGRFTSGVDGGWLHRKSESLGDEKSPTWILTPVRLARSLVTTPTELTRHHL